MAPGTGSLPSGLKKRLLLAIQNLRGRARGSILWNLRAGGSSGLPSLSLGT